MNFFFFHIPVKNRKDEAHKHAVFVHKEQLHNITDGGEFLDDAIRMIDQPLMYTGERTRDKSAELFT